MAESKLFRWVKGGVGLLRDFAYPSGEAGPKRPTRGTGAFRRIPRARNCAHRRAESFEGTSHSGGLHRGHKRWRIDWRGVRGGDSVGRNGKAGGADGVYGFRAMETFAIGIGVKIKSWTNFLARFTKCTRFEDLRIPMAVAATGIGLGKNKNVFLRPEICGWRFARRARIRVFLCRWK